MRFILFFTVVWTLFLYLGWRWCRLLALRGLRRLWVWGPLVAGLLTAQALLMLYRRMDLDWDAFPLMHLYWVSFAWVGFLVTVLLLTAPVDLAYQLGRLARWGWRRFFSRPERVPAPPDLARRHWLISRGGAAALGACAGMSGFGIYLARKGPVLKKVRIPVPPALAGLSELRLVQFTDLHVSPTCLRDDVSRVVELVQSASPTAVVFTGDLVDGSVPRLRPHVEPLGRLSAPLGVFFVTGNHEYYSGAESWLEEVRRLGMIPLINEHRVLTVGGVRLALVGVPDQSAAQFIPSHVSDPVAALAGVPPVDYRILLAHRPASCFDAAKAGYDLMLSGHTHGGQFFPWSLFVPLAHPYTRGLNRHEERLWVYVSNGSGFWGPPLRLGAQEEVTLFEFVPDASA